jgi:WD40 repeat protein/tRNA A-37 threonylcarbamoyl transferase component Bud32
MPEAAGRALGEFVLRDKLGEGAFGEVYRADQPVLQREAVVKVLHRRYTADASLRQRFLQEARLASRLDHPLAAHVYSYGAEGDGTLWIAMELVRGQPLDRFLAEHGPIPVERLVPVLDQISDVVHSAHEKGIVHRDLKPANVMIRARGDRLVPTLLDFGLARIVSRADDAGGPPVVSTDSPRLTQAGARVGTPLYMAPEQWARDGVADARSDQYALAILAFECLSGRVPFTGTMAEVGRAHLERPLPPLGGALAPFDAVLARAAAKQPRDRFPSVLDFAAAMRGAAGLAPEAPLAQLPPALARAVAAAPQPIADAIAALEAARNAHHALDLVEIGEQVVLRWLGAVALAGRTAVQPAALSERLRSLRHHSPDPDEWIDLIGELVAPYAEAPETFPVPELVRWAAARVEAEPATAASGDLAVADLLHRRVEALDALLASVAFLEDYPLVVQRRDAEIWMGTRRVARRRAPVTRLLPEDEAFLCDRAWRPVLALAPLVQLRPPAPDAPPELFLFAGPGRHGARLVAAPLGFERFDEGVWDWMRQLLAESQPVPGEMSEENPYPGLRSFAATEASLFLGREAETAAFVNRLRVQSLLVVAGPSGSGKSSFVHAGVVPALPEGWRALSLRPGAEPVATLCRKVAALLDLPAPPEPAALRDALASAGPVVIVLDQFEELFTVARDAAVATRLAETLVALAREPTRVVLVVRDDFLALAHALAPLGDRLSGALVLLGTPPPPDLARIVLEPARRAGYDVDDPDLVRDMVDAVAGRPGALPLLAFTAAALWERRDRHFRRLTRKAYEALGGVGGALARHADGVLAGLSAAERGRAREAFRLLLTPEGTRAAPARADLVEVSGEGVVEALIAARLLEVSEDGRVELVHEALIASWPRLADWQREDREGARLLAQLRAAARTWDEQGRPRGLLWRGTALAEYRLWRARSPAVLTSVEHAFAAASVLDEARGRRARAALATAAFVVLAAAAFTLYLFARRAERAAAENRARLLDSYVEQGRRLLLGGDPQRALAYLDAAYRQGVDGVDLRFLLARGLEAFAPQRLVLPAGDLVYAARFAGPGRILTATRGGELALWDERGRARFRVRAHDRGGLIAAALSPDGTRAATAGFDGSARLWRLEDGQRLQTLAHGGPVTDVAFDAGGRLLSASRDGSVKIWDAATGAAEATLAHDGPVLALAPARDGARILTGTDGGTVTLWSGTAPLWRAASGDSVRRVVFAAGDTVAAAAAGASVRTWDAASGAPRATLDHAAPIRDLAVSADGARLASASQDGTARVWDVASGRLVAVLVGHDGWVYAVAFCAGDKLVVTGGVDRTVRLWDAASGRPLRTFFGHRDMVKRVTCDAAGRILSAAHDGTARLWDPAATAARGAFATGALVADLGASRDGTRIVTVGVDGRVVVSDAASGAALATLGRPGTHPLSAQLAADGRTVAVALYDERLAELWDVAGGTLLRTFAGHTQQVNRTQLSPDGTLLVTSSRDGTSRLWSIETGRELRRLRGDEGWMLDAAFSPDGKRLATAGQDQTARIWDVDSGAPLVILRGHTSWVQRVAFDRAGERLLTAASDGTAKIWDARDGRLLASLEGHLLAPSAAVWSPSGALVATSGDDDVAKVWDGRSGRLLWNLASHHGLRGRVVFLDEGTLATSDDGDDRVLTWDVGLERRPPAELEGRIACLSPFELRGGELLPRAAPPACGP